ncbi:MAG: hypothetical protein V9E98_03750 [Candidatus Nanopelagicales bacterium]
MSRIDIVARPARTWPEHDKPSRFSYIARNLWVRRVTTLLTAGGMALVVYVFATVLMMSEGIRATLVATGQPDNVMVLRKGAGAEINSGDRRASRPAIIESLPGIATDAPGPARCVSKEPVVLNNLPKRGSGKPSNVTRARHLAAGAGSCGRRCALVEGRMFRPAPREIVAGPRGGRRLRAACGLGETLRFARPRLDRWSASSTPAAAASIPRSGAMPNR